MRHSGFTVSIVAMSALLTLLAACNHGEEAAAPARPVLVEHPQPLMGESGEAFPGSVRSREEGDLGFRVPGKILSRKVEAGQSVQPGTVLATLDPEDAALNQKASEASVSAAEADMKLAESELARNKDMLDKGFISKSVYDVRENQYRLAQARHEQAQSNLAVIRNQSSYTTLKADKAGLITAVLAEAGQVVAAGQPVFRFAGGGEREVVIYVPEGRVEALRKAKLGVSLWAIPGKLFAGRLREVNLQADRSTRTHEARIGIEGADASVQLGMSATVTMGSRVDGQWFRVPLSAVDSRKQQQAQVWVVDAGGHAKPLPVQVARYDETVAVVSGALTPEMQVVTAGVHLMVPDMQVTPQTRRRPGDAAGAGASP